MEWAVSTFTNGLTAHSPNLLSIRTYRHGVEINMASQKIRVLVIGAREGTVAAIKNASKPKAEIELVKFIETGTEGIVAASQLVPNVIMVDSSTPDIDSIELVRLLHEQVSSSKIILMSFVNDPEWMRRGIQAGVNNFLPLPPDEEQLYSTIAIWLGIDDATRNKFKSSMSNRSE